MHSTSVTRSERSTPDRTSKDRLEGTYLILAWITCALIALLAIVLLCAGLLFRLHQFNTPSTFSLPAPWTVEALRATLVELYLPVEFYGFYRLTLDLLSAFCFFFVAVLILRRKFKERMTLFVACFLLFFGAVWSVPIDQLALAYPFWFWPLTILEQLSWGSLLIFFFLFPDGRFVPSRFRRPIIGFTGTWLLVECFFPLAKISELLNLWVWFICLGAVIAAQFHRYRRVAGPVQRQQIKWLLFGLTIAVVALLLMLVVGNILSSTSKVGALELLYRFVLDAFGTLVFLPIPFSIGLAVLRYRLWDINIFISRTLISSLMTLVVVGIYILIVGSSEVFFQANNNFVVALFATGVVAVLFQPLRERIQRGINHLLYGEGDDPYTVISHLVHRLDAVLEPEAVLPTIVEHVTSTLKLPHASLWSVEAGVFSLESVQSTAPLNLSVSDRGTVEVLQTQREGIYLDSLPRTATFSTVLAQLGADFLLPLLHHGELVGTLCLARRSADDVFSPTDQRVLRELAIQIGAMVHAVRLDRALRLSLQDVQQSRQRLVAAQEEERQRIQRDLHDGLGPTLASIRLRVGTCLSIAEGGPAEMIQELEQLDHLAKQATSDIRRLVYALRPPMLDQLGLLASLQQHIESVSYETALAVSLQAESDLSLPAAVEVALFRVVGEALVNVHKHAHASQVHIQLQRQEEGVLLVLQDDGQGFSLQEVTHKLGTGLRSMQERAEFLGGSFHITSSIENGTTLRMQIPVSKGHEQNEQENR